MGQDTDKDPGRGKYKDHDKKTALLVQYGFPNSTTFTSLDNYQIYDIEITVLSIKNYSLQHNLVI